MTLLLLLHLAESRAQPIQVTAGTVRSYPSFGSRHIKPRNIDVWLPPGFDSSKKYAVLYLHEGQMLFDSSITRNRQKWGVDETVSGLLMEELIGNCLVVSIWNSGSDRLKEYFPEKIFGYPEPVNHDTVVRSGNSGDAPSAYYLYFLVRVLKPFIDNHYPTYADPAHTYAAGSGLGGLISLFALCEYPDIFGGAACMSTYWPVGLRKGSTEISDAFREYLRQKIPAAGHHRIYFDYGTAAMDSLYPPLQKKVDAILEEKGYSPRYWRTMAFPDTDQDEKAWQKRLRYPLSFLLGPLPYEVTMRLDPGSITETDSATCFLAGNLNGWNPADLNSAFRSSAGGPVLRFPWNAKTPLQYKITRGDWSKTECDVDGMPADNHEVQIKGDTLIRISVAHWTDRTPKKHTASRQVRLGYEQFESVILGNTRKIWIYLPASYEHDRDKRYPVIYLQDGQNLFDRAIAFGGQEWRVDETLDSLASTGIPAYIVVGIESGPARLNEYLPYPSRHLSNATGEQYLQFIVQELMPEVNNTFRTLTGPAHTSIGGSSMGGLISLYGILQYPQVFGSAAVFSTSFWVVDEFLQTIPPKSGKLKGHFFFYAGDAESESLVDDTRAISELITQRGAGKVQLSISPGGRHNEQYWQQPFRDFVLWMKQGGGRPGAKGR
jgi:predicted alpha/beta superfamily hydrolase